MSDLHYFPRYSQRENHVTNNALLLLQRFYHFDKYKFQKLITLLDSEAEIDDISVGLRFRQQVSRGQGVVDGYLDQQSLRIAIETKTHDWFGFEQLQRHQRGLGVADQRILMLLSPVVGNFKHIDINEIREANEKVGIDTINATFERLILACRAVLSEFNEEMHALVDDFEGFCSAEGLLPSDHRLMLVPPCYHSRNENVELKLYYCPLGRIARQPKYLGIYWHKSVRYVGEISTRVTPEFDQNRKIVGPVTLSDGEKSRIETACELALTHRWDIATGTEFFLCNELFETDYPKLTPGGIQGFQYHDLGYVIKEWSTLTMGEIAERLRSCKWKGYGKPG